MIASSKLHTDCTYSGILGWANKCLNSHAELRISVRLSDAMLEKFNPSKGDPDCSPIMVELLLRSPLSVQQVLAFTER